MKPGGQNCTWGTAEAALFPCVPGQCLLQLPAGRCSAESLATLRGMNTQVRGMCLRRGRVAWACLSIAVWKRKAGWERACPAAGQERPRRCRSWPGVGEWSPWPVVPLGSADLAVGLTCAGGGAAIGLEGRRRAGGTGTSTCALSLSLAVIGQKVNLAARMMVHYPGLVSCDAATYAASQLPPYYFKQLPERKMKGLSHPGTIYQYVGITKRR